MNDDEKTDLSPPDQAIPDQIKQWIAILGYVAAGGGPQQADLQYLALQMGALEAFVVDNPELEQLEALLSQFNLFEAIGAVRMEVRHSDFLAFLLDPKQNHGLGDLFLKRLLQKIVASKGQGASAIRPVHLDLMGLSKTVVRREWKNTDILCISDDNRLVVLIENKIDSGEGEDQLQRYLQEVEREYPPIKEFKTLPLFLTPEGDNPADENSRYIPVNYSLVCKTLEDLLITQRSVIGIHVFTTVTHYVQMLRRHIVSDSPIADLAKKIYAKHRQALDVIFEHRPDRQLEFREMLEKMIRAEVRGLVLDHCSKGYVRFLPKEWNDIEALNKGEGWTPTKRILLFQFNNFPPDHLELGLYIGPGVEALGRLGYGCLMPVRRIATFFERSETSGPEMVEALVARLSHPKRL